MPSEKRCPVKRRLKKVFCPWPSVHNVLLFLTAIFFLSLIDMDKGQWASWVQAIGSVGAILVAAYVPIWHLRVVNKNKQLALGEIMRVVADEASDSMHLLASLFQCPEREKSLMMKYEGWHRSREWAAYADHLKQIPVAELSSAMAKDLSYLKDAVSFGFLVAEKIPGWIKSGGHSQPDVVRILHIKRKVVDLVRLKLPVPLGVESPNLTQSQMSTMAYEFRTVPLEPLSLDEGEIYIRYVYEGPLFQFARRAYVYGVYAHSNGFGPNLIVMPTPVLNFPDFKEYVANMCRVLHQEHMAAEYIAAQQMIVSVSPVRAR